MAHGILNSGHNTVGYGGESDLAFEAGDIIRNHYVAYLNGYPGHQSRTICVGPPSDEQPRIYRTTIDQYVPGAPAADFYHFANERFSEPASRAPTPWLATASVLGGTIRNPTWHRPANAP